MRIVVAGVSGSGKTTIGTALAQRLGSTFLDADSFHPAANVAKMKAGIPLDDEDRAGWLDILGAELAKREDVVLACSALKKAYRDHLRELAGEIHFVLLSVDPDDIRHRIAHRGEEGHFMPPSLLDSQFATLEKGEDMEEITNVGTPDEVVDRLIAGLKS
ncbi:MAG: transferase [Akkermansiaceae bacterium]|nr:transferase [Akkermansiaceae bacterium]